MVIRNQFDPLKPHEWKDCSESDSKYAKVPAEIHGFVGFNDTEGGGETIGAHDDRFVIVLINDFCVIVTCHH